MWQVLSNSLKINKALALIMKICMQRVLDYVPRNKGVYSKIYPISNNIPHSSLIINFQIKIVPQLIPLSIFGIHATFE